MSFEKIKKQNGEGFAKTIRDYHNGIFEVPNIVKIVKHAGNSPQDAEKNLNYLITLLAADVEEEVVVEDMFTLLDRAGYHAFYADTLEKQNSIKKYFKKGEELCTFDDPNRFKNYYIVNAIKHDVDDIKREDFTNPQREDRYGTSVISIQIAKSGGFISIKNRYNHSVANCDNTFKSNPDNIIAGLSAAMQKHFNVTFSKSNNALAEGYTLVNKKIFKINYEINGIFYGDTAYIKNGAIVELGPHEYLFDYFIFDASKKEFRMVDDRVVDSFPNDFNAVYAGKPSIYVKKHCIYDGDIMLVGV